jgi:hypothetical protein
MKKVIALEGPANSGKSETIRIVYEELTTRLVRTRRHIRFSVEANRKPKETAAVLTVNGIKIGLVSEGDTPETLSKSLLSLELQGCTIIVCASRPTAKCREAVDGLSRSGYEIERIDKKQEPNESDRDSANRKVAQDVVSKITDLLDLEPSSPNDER